MKRFNFVRFFLNFFFIGDSGGWTDKRIHWKRRCLTAMRIWLIKNTQYKNAFCYKVIIEVLQLVLYIIMVVTFCDTIVIKWFASVGKIGAECSLEIVLRHF